MSGTTPSSGCPNPNFCYEQGCLGKCGQYEIKGPFDKEVMTSLNARLALERAEVILANMALENTGFWASIFNRWAISAEPLRNDAAAALPEIRRAGEAAGSMSWSRL